MSERVLDLNLAADCVIELNRVMHALASSSSMLITYGHEHHLPVIEHAGDMLHVLHGRLLDIREMLRAMDSESEENNGRLPDIQPVYIPAARWRGGCT